MKCLFDKLQRVAVRVETRSHRKEIRNEVFIEPERFKRLSKDLGGRRAAPRLTNGHVSPKRSQRKEMHKTNVYE